MGLWFDRRPSEVADNQPAAPRPGNEVCAEMNMLGRDGWQYVTTTPYFIVMESGDVDGA